MIANALLITIAIMLPIGFTLMGELKFLLAHLDKQFNIGHSDVPVEISDEE